MYLGFLFTEVIRDHCELLPCVPPAFPRPDKGRGCRQPGWVVLSYFFLN